MRILILSCLFLFLNTIVHGQLIIDEGEFLTEYQATQLTRSMQDLRDSSSVETLIFTAIDYDRGRLELLGVE